MHGRYFALFSDGKTIDSLNLRAWSPHREVCLTFIFYFFGDVLFFSLEHHEC